MDSSYMDPTVRIVMVIEGHDWRYSGDGWKWTREGEGWDRLKRTGYNRKECMICGTVAAPTEPVQPCYEIWAEKAGFLSAPTREQAFELLHDIANQEPTP